MILDEASGKLTQKMFAKRDKIASSQIFCQLEIIVCWANGFTTDNKFLKPHIEECSMFSGRYRSSFHVLIDISFPSANILCFDLERSLF